MDIIVKGADFSANKIGIAISQKTLDVVSATGATLTNTELEGLNVYLNALTTNSLLGGSKLTRFYLPVLQTDITKSFVNVADDNLAVDIVPTAGEVAYINKGLYNTENSAISQLEVPTTSDGLSSASFSFLSYVTNFDSSKLNGIAQYKDPNSSAWYGSMELTNGQDWISSNNSKIKIANSTPGLTETFEGTSGILSFGLKNMMYGYTLNQVDRDGGVFIKNTGIATRFYTAAGVGYAVGNLTANLRLTSNVNDWMTLPHGMVAIGGGLTQAEMQLVNDATIDFMKVMGVNNVPA
jgi:hypothetical protein